MKRLLSLLVLLLCFVLLLPGLTHASTLDTSGGGGELRIFKLTNLHLIKAGGKPLFHIKLTATGVVYMPGMSNWPDKVVLFTVFGNYSYDDGQAFEIIYVHNPGNPYQNDSEFSVQFIAEKNPWVHGAGQPGYVINVVDHINHGGFFFQVPESYPLSAYYMPADLRQVLVKWEQSPTPGTELDDWDPYAGSAENDNKLAIETPTASQVIPKNAASFQVIVTTQFKNENQTLQIQWERLVKAPEWVGDIKMPDNMTQIWEPFPGPDSVAMNQLPMEISVSPGYFANKAGLYRLKVRLPGFTGWTAWRYFWIGKPHLDIKQKNLSKITAQTQQFMHAAMLKQVMAKVKASRTEFLKRQAAQKTGFNQEKNKLKIQKINKTTGELQLHVQHAAAQGNIIYAFEKQVAGHWQKIRTPRIEHARTSKGNGLATTTARLRVKAPGAYRFRCRLGKGPWSKWQEFTVKSLSRITAAHAKPVVNPASMKSKSHKNVTQFPANRSLTKAPRLVFFKPSQVLTAPATLKLKAQYVGSSKLVYELLKNGHVIRTSDSGEFSNVPVGHYTVRVRSNEAGAKFSSPVPFVVKANPALTTRPKIRIKSNKSNLKSPRMMQKQVK